MDVKVSFAVLTTLELVVSRVREEGEKPAVVIESRWVPSESVKANSALSTLIIPSPEKPIMSSLVYLCLLAVPISLKTIFLLLKFIAASLKTFDAPSKKPSTSVEISL